jgi:hypothetical protein
MARERERQRALTHLPRVRIPSSAGRNGEELATDEAAVWKRVLNFRIAKYLRPKTIMETHPGFGISTRLFRCACPRARFYNQRRLPNVERVDLLDVDPFGQPWDTLSRFAGLIDSRTVVFVTNGEAYAVIRNWRRAQRFPTRFFGREMPKWVTKEYIPRVEELFGLPCRFFYAFPTSVRSIHSKHHLPKSIFHSCPRWMWWLEWYANN